MGGRLNREKKKLKRIRVERAFKAFKAFNSGAVQKYNVNSTFLEKK